MANKNKIGIIRSETWMSDTKIEDIGAILDEVIVEYGPVDIINIQVQKSEGGLYRFWVFVKE